MGCSIRGELGKLGSELGSELKKLGSELGKLGKLESEVGSELVKLGSEVVGELGKKTYKNNDLKKKKKKTVQNTILTFIRQKRAISALPTNKPAITPTSKYPLYGAPFCLAHFKTSK